ncbi:MAG: aminotransferase class I/II-fold pyridoxal phosphate-dependent enzyme [Clostridia bacterium]|nr:aminotransferase class I/II-fold pyridoxal phosphate-dependent enzyme [Clostridia bacterium]
MDYKDIPILKALKDYAEEGLSYFHMPGHKGGNVFKKTGLTEFDIELLRMDVTEVPGIDNLHCPEGAIETAQERAAKAFGAEHTFFLVNGTTGGIYSMIMAATKPGDKVIIPRNCHRAVTGAVILGKLHPVYISPEFDVRLEIASGISTEAVLKAVQQNPDAKAVVVTNPTYYGVCSDLEKLAEIAHSHNMLLLVDEAHGAHFAFNKRLPKSALECGADMVAQSTHKTLTSMTQSSMLHVRSERVDIDKLKLFLQLTQTTSPSHILLASLDTARYIMQEKGEKLLDDVIDWCDSFRKEMEAVKGIHCLGSKDIGRDGIYDFDRTRLTVNLSELNISGTEADKLLRSKFKLQVEMADLNNIVAICSVGDTESDIEKLAQALKHIASDAPEKHKTSGYKPKIYSKIPKMELMPWEAVYRQSEDVPLMQSVGCISGEMIIPYPPGIPIVMPGEVITREILDYALDCLYNGIKINGVKDAGLKFIQVLK